MWCGVPVTKGDWNGKLHFVYKHSSLARLFLLGANGILYLLFFSIIDSSKNKLNVFNIYEKGSFWLSMFAINSILFVFTYQPKSFLKMSRRFPRYTFSPEFLAAHTLALPPQCRPQQSLNPSSVHSFGVFFLHPSLFPSYTVSNRWSATRTLFLQIQLTVQRVSSPAM